MMELSQEPTTIAAIIALLEKEHREKSPDCPTKTTDLLVAVHDPIIRDSPSGTRGMVRLVHVERHKANLDRSSE